MSKKTPRFPTLVACLQHWAKETPDAVGFTFLNKQLERHTLTWAHLHTLSGRFAAKLHAQGLGRGDLVVNTLPNGPERLVGEAGVWMSGAATVNGQCQLADGSDLIRTLRVSRASALLVDPDVEDSPWNVLNNHVKLVSASHHDHELTQHVECESLPELKKVFLVRRVEGRGRGDFLRDLEAGSDWFQADDLTSDDPLAVFTTSGTTGFSKLFVYTHYAFVRTDLGDDVPDVKINTLNIAPMGWVGGFPGITLRTGGGRVAIDLRAGGNPEDMEDFLWKTIQQERCDSALISPTYFRRLSQIAKEEKEKAKIRGEDEAAIWKLRNIFLGGLPISRFMVEAGLSLAHTVFIAYGSTDCAYVSGMMVTDSESYVDHDTGPPAKGVQVKIVSLEDETQVLPTNQTGSILVKSPYITARCLSDPQATATATATTDDGFYRTGDLGRLDERGHLLVEGRGSDAIMRGPYIFYPGWLEARIRAACPAVRDVMIIGVPDPDVNEELCACVVLESENVDVEQVRQAVERDIVTKGDDPLSPRPRYYLQFPAFPVTTTDKPRRVLVKALAAERLNLI